MTAQTAAGMVAAAKQRIENLPVEQVEQELKDHDVVLVDIRESDERKATGEIPGAVHAPRGMLEFYADPASPYHRPELEPDRRIILYCASSGRSALAADMLREFGYKRAAHLDGGIKAWQEAGKPVEPVSS